MEIQNMDGTKATEDTVRADHDKDFVYAVGATVEVPDSTITGGANAHRVFISSSIAGQRWSTNDARFSINLIHTFRKYLAKPRILERIER